jgi:hypothetical protein
MDTELVNQTMRNEKKWEMFEKLRNAREKQYIIRCERKHCVEELKDTDANTKSVECDGDNTEEKLVDVDLASFDMNQTGCDRTIVNSVMSAEQSGHSESMDEMAHGQSELSHLDNPSEENTIESVKETIEHSCDNCLRLDRYTQGI